jgi:hypothetical protein
VAGVDDHKRSILHLLPPLCCGFKCARSFAPSHVAQARSLRRYLPSEAPWDPQLQVLPPHTRFCSSPSSSRCCTSSCTTGWAACAISCGTTAGSATRLRGGRGGGAACTLQAFVCDSYRPMPCNTSRPRARAWSVPVVLLNTCTLRWITGVCCCWLIVVRTRCTV